MVVAEAVAQLSDWFEVHVGDAAMVEGSAAAVLDAWDVELEVAVADMPVSRVRRIVMRMIVGIVVAMRVCCVLRLVIVVVVAKVSIVLTVLAIFHAMCMCMVIRAAWTVLARHHILRLDVV